MWNLLPADKNGNTQPVNVLASKFVQCDGKSHLVTIVHPEDPERKVEKELLCPSGLWSAAAQADASVR
ncbi:MAG: hypothetical protein M3M85_02840 [bacterium]|nr:hypothetical protein [bacterium]